MLSETAERVLGRLHQVARHASGLPCGIPDFLIIGAQKGGTTSLYAYLAQHPNVIPAVRKEVHFFESPRNRRRGTRWYRSFFPSELYLKRQTRRLGSPARTGEATTYMPYPRIPEQLHAIAPDAKLIFLLRNPIDRAFSHYEHVRRSYPGFETLSFGEAIRREAERTQPDIDAVAADEWHDDVTFRTVSYVHTGLYAVHLQQWLKYYDRQDMYVTESERFFQRPAEILEEVRAFLGLPEFRFDASEQHNVGDYRDKMDATDREFLLERFREDRAELQRLLGTDIGAGWF